VTRRLRTRTIYDLDVLEVDDRQALLGSGVSPGRTSGSCVTTSASRRASARTWAISAAPPPTRSTTATCTLQDLVDGLTWAREGDDAFLREVVRPAEDALVHLPSVTIAPSAARNVATGAPVYAPGVIDVDSVSEGGGETTGTTPIATPLVACHTPDGAAVCLGRLVGDPDAESGVVVSLERVLVWRSSRSVADRMKRSP